MNFGHLRIALITLAKPEKNFLPSSKSAIDNNSSKEAPAQNALVPSLFKIISEIALFLSIAVNSSVKFCNNVLGNELLAGCENVIVATDSLISVSMKPNVVIIFLN